MFGKKKLEQELLLAELGTQKVVVARVDAAGSLSLNARLKLLQVTGWEILNVSPGASKYQKLVLAQKVRLA